MSNIDKIFISKFISLKNVKYTMQYFMKMKLKTLFFIFIICAVFSTFLIFFYQTSWVSYNILDLPRIVWWTPFTLRDHLEELNCGDFRCAITDNRIYANNARAFLFYGSNMHNWDLPSRKKDQIWSLLHEESPKNSALFLDERAIKLFNITSTFSRYSDVPLTLQHFTNIEDLTSIKYYISTHIKDEYRNNGLAPILYIQSDCETPLNRDSYVTELMKYVKVDSYGKCLKNKDFPPELQSINHLNDLYEPNMLKLVAKYKFTLAFENAACDDYITEKIWRPLMAGSVPIYLGAKTIVDWLPDGQNSAILADNFTSPRELAEYIMILDQDSRKYERHLQHKLSDTYPVTNELLLKVLRHSWNTLNSNFIDKLECKVCEVITKGVEIGDKIMKNVYNCPKPISPVNKKINDTNWWTQHWNEAPCHFKLVNDILNHKVNYTEKEYNEKVLEISRMGLCDNI